MIEYVDLDTVKAHLKVGTNIDDVLIEGMVFAASAAVKNYLKGGSAYEHERDALDNFVLDADGERIVALDDSQNPIMKEDVKVSVLLLVRRWYDSNIEGIPNDGLPSEVQALLYPLRDPALI